MAKFFLGLFGLVYATGVSAALDEAFRNSFPNLVQDQCRSSLSYSLDDAFGAKQKEYHERVNCIFSQGLKKAVERDNAEVLQKANELNVSFPLEVPPISSCSVSLEEISAQQKINGLKTRCTFEGGDSNIEKDYSACAIAEMALAEWCGYEQFLIWKSKDETFQSVRSTLGGGGKGSGYLSNDSVRSEELATELERSKKAMRESLRQYQKIRQSYRWHVSLELILAQLKNTQKMSSTIREAVYTWPEKFINASSHICDQ